ncbi:phosphodiester glycosidase family protein [Catenuloplanes japonicus]|uniref:phosphodiester glycosidase family protein n=1 Tax=Catenuloplanes japonicus TaxID=33876 RepID=UPI0005270954|nr:phosphodiester glycosidase family protein [Catenuloplanes japonicus]
MQRRGRIALAALTGLAVVAGPALPVSASPAVKGLPLGPAGLPETRTTQTLAPGVVLTTITRGKADPNQVYWTIGINIPLGEVLEDPDPDADKGALGTAAKAQAVKAQLLANPAVAAELAARGWEPRIEAVDYAPTLTGYRGGLIGYTLRIGRFADRAATASLISTLAAAGFSAFALNTGQDGRPTSTGPWLLRVLTVDPDRFRGKVTSSVGDAISGQQTTSSIAAAAGAVYGVNGGYFTINPNDGTPGVPAGLSVLHGTPVTAATNNRAVLVLRDNGRRAEIENLSSRYALRFGTGRTHLVDALNRLPGKIRDCGGVGGDQPTERPVHDFTCTDPDEIVVFTDGYGVPTPTGPGVEALIDRTGRVVTVRDRIGGTVPAGHRIVQAIGTDAAWLTANARVGALLTLDTTVVDARGRTVCFGPRDFVVNGGPQLVSDGRVAVNPLADGLVHEDPSLGLPDSALGASFGYNWFIRDNPRTGAGVDRQGRLILIQVDGRQAGISQGLPIKEFAEVFKSLGAVEAINLDGGGSSATVVNGTLISSPSDLNSAGQPTERATGDVILVNAR